MPITLIFFALLYDGELVLIAIPLPTKIAPAMTMNVVVSIAVIRIRLLSVDMNVFCILAQTENVKTVTVADFQKKKKNEPRREGGRVIEIYETWRWMDTFWLTSNSDQFEYEGIQDQFYALLMGWA